MPELSVPPVPITKACDPIEQQARQDALDALYLLDGRDSHDHPLHSLYTGLTLQYASTSTNES